MKEEPMQTFNPKIPILMYHEVSDASSSHRSTYNLTPLYDLPVTMFERQMELLLERGYKSLLFDKIPAEMEEKGNYIIITFDDGLKGNYKYGLPVLQKYGFNATVFIVVDRIGSERFMQWSELKALVASGISVQSHTMSHRPLQTLTDKEVYHELYMSKQVIEDKLQKEVLALSFPHGSYNQKVTRMAKEVGYKYLCTSDIECTYYHSLLKEPAILGRIAMTTKLNTERFIKCLEYDKKEVLRIKLSKKAKNLTKRMIGIDRYRKIYRYLFNISLDA